jgi:hypothetical protein
MIAWIAYFFAGVFLANGMPHFIQGIRGKKFQTPFAKPWGSESSAVVNVIWGIVNFIIASALLRVGDFSLASIGHFAVAAIGFLVISVALALYFGKKS